MNFFVIGTGRVGRMILQLQKQSGGGVTGAWTRSQESAHLCEKQTGLMPQCGGQPILSPETTHIWFTIPDDQIRRTALELSERNLLPEDATLVHCSGTTSPTVLQDLATAHSSATIHPLQAFTGNKGDVEAAQEACWFLTGEQSAITPLSMWLQGLGIRTYALEDEHRTIYHIAAVLASNGLVGLVSRAMELLEEIGIPKHEGIHVLAPLLDGTLSNLRERGLPDALTGPVSRGDSAVLASHLEALQSQGETPDLYRLLSSQLLREAERKGTLSKNELETLRALLQRKD